MPDDTIFRGRGTGDGGQIQDTELLRRYLDEASQAAFGALVERHLTLVYSAALRQAGGDAHLAQDVTQMVFVDLARKAAVLAQRPMLAGWLHTSTRFAAAKAVRTERRRQAREERAHLMQEILHDPDSHLEWDRVRPILDEALGELGELDREAVLLRFFERQTLAAVGARLALTETAARSRVDRALEKLRGLLARRGVASTSAALAIALANQASVAAPAGLAASVTGAGMAAGVAAGGGWAAFFMSMTKLQVGIAGALAIAGATAYVSQGQTNAALRQEITALQTQKTSIAALQVENRQLTSALAEVEVLRQDDAELARLSQEVTDTQLAQKERSQLAANPPASVYTGAATIAGGSLKYSAGTLTLSGDIRQRDPAVQAEIDRINREGNNLVDEYKAAAQKANDPSLTAEAKEEIQTALKQKMAEIRAKQQEVQAFKENAQAKGLLPATVKMGKLQLSGSAPDGSVPPTSLSSQWTSNAVPSP